MSRRILFVLLAALVAAAPIESRLWAQPDALAGLDAALTQGARDWQVPGLAVAVVKDGSVVFSKGYGVREFGKPGSVDEHTLFAIGSTTKAMTAALVGMLVDEKKLAWDDPVAKYLPWFASSDPYLTREITVRDLLTHRAGLGNADYLWYGQPTGPRGILERVRLLPPAYSLRSSFIYQNVMYAAAGAVVEAISGRPWAEMMRTRIFEPLGMSETIATAATLSQQPNVAQPHCHDCRQGDADIENASVDGVAPAGSVWSSVHDMAKWSAMLLEGGKAGSRVLLAPGHRGGALHAAGDGDRRGVLPDRAAHQAEVDGPTAWAGSSRTIGDARWITTPAASMAWWRFTACSATSARASWSSPTCDHAELRHAIMLDVFDRYIGGGRRDWSSDLRGLYDGLRREAEAEERKVEERRVAGTKPTLRWRPTPARIPTRCTATSSSPSRATGSAPATAAPSSARSSTGTTTPSAPSGTPRGEAPPALTFVLDADGKPTRLEAMGAGAGSREPLSVVPTMRELRVAVRSLVRQPGMAALAVVALGLGTGLTTTMFSIVNGAVLRGLPFPESDRILHLAPFNIAEQDDLDTNLHTFAEFRDRQQSFEQLAAFQFQSANVVGPSGVPARYEGARVTANTFRLLRVSPLIGRDFRDEDGAPGAAAVVMIGDKVWQEQFGGSPDAIGQALRVNGVAMTIVGVMPATFRFPSAHDIWPALIVDPAGTTFGQGPGLETLGRLRPGLSMDEAGAEMAVIWRQLEQAYPTATRVATPWR